MAERPDEMRDRRPAGTDTDDPDRIRAEIERTRGEMAETVDSIQERLSPERLKREAVDSVREATIGRAEEMAETAARRAKGFRANFVSTVKENPIPAAMVGLGLGWLLMESRSRGPQYRHDYGDRAYYYYRPGGEMRHAGSEARWRAERAMGEARGRAEELGEEARSRVEDLSDEARMRAEHLGDEARMRVERFGEDARETAENLTAEAREQAEHLSYEARMQARRAQSQFNRMMRENPLAVGAAAVALGALVGASIPETRQEEELFGPARDNLMEKARETAEETMHKVQRVAEEAVEAAAEGAEQAAKEEGIKK